MCNSVVCVLHVHVCGEFHVNITKIPLAAEGAVYHVSMSDKATQHNKKEILGDLNSACTTN